MKAKMDPPPSYHNHAHHYIQNRNQFQSPNPLSASVSASNGAQVHRQDKLSASMNDSDK